MLGFLRLLIVSVFLGCVGVQGYRKCDNPNDVNGNPIYDFQCDMVLQKYQHRGDFIVDDKPSNRKSCYGCQIVFDTTDNSNIYILEADARSAIGSILNNCYTRTGFIITGNTRVTVRKGFGKECPNV